MRLLQVPSQAVRCRSASSAYGTVPARRTQGSRQSAKRPTVIPTSTMARRLQRLLWLFGGI